MRLVLHIGMPKTGTSAIQAALLNNPKALSQAGFLFPQPLFGLANHNALTTLFRPIEKINREFTSGNSASLDDYRVAGLAFWHHIERQVQASSAHTTVLSGEYLYGISPAEVKQLHDFLAPVFDPIEVVVYVREPAAYYLSFVQQRVRASWEVPAPAGLKLRVENCLPRFAATFGNVSAHAYDPASLVNGDIVTDFLTKTGLAEIQLAEHKASQRTNSSASAEAMCIMQQFRRHGWPDANNQFAPESNLVWQTLSGYRDQFEQHSPALRPEIAEGILNLHAESLQYLRDEFDLTFNDIDLSTLEQQQTPPPERLALLESTDLRQILDVEPDAINRTLFLLLKFLAARTTAP